QYFAWDDNSQPLARRDDNGNTTQYIDDNQNRTKVERKALRFTGTAFTVRGGESGTFNVPLRGGVAPVVTRPGPTDITYGYDRDTNLVTRVDEAGNVSRTDFDALNREKTRTISLTAGFIGTSRQSWQYDGLSRVTAAIDNNNPDPAATTDNVTTTDFY